MCRRMQRCAGAAHHVQAAGTSRPEHGATLADIKPVRPASRPGSATVMAGLCLGVQGCAGRKGCRALLRCCMTVCGDAVDAVIS